MMAKTFPKSLVFLLVCSLHSTTGQDDDERVVVQTRFGSIRGRVRQTDTGARVNEFLGIPYASAPVGDLRFKRAQYPTDFEDTYEADKMPPACLQYSEQPLPWFDLDPGQSEDCLYLNIWAPADTGYWERPVKIFIHGGGWFEGGSNRLPFYNGFAEAVDTLDENGNSTFDGIIVVTINYR
ncbi:hypothetical protein JTE90_014272 [Oedothorax gibbosus]|uniref:Carboxylesterase type B domain-containing protein n=1 Tax=Oedothorax gibbosus TaxID=931172 RepID=A0AAV6U078_9ARAC|nr:hypothetical protein JTE90_014272 [Oedothorax gibbosus]